MFFSVFRFLGHQILFHLCSYLSLDVRNIFQGYTIPLDKRLAADGRGLQTVHINENFAKLAEALYIADRKVPLCCPLLCGSELLHFPIICTFFLIHI